jgi:hypothetical protein
MQPIAGGGPILRVPTEKRKYARGGRGAVSEIWDVGQTSCRMKKSAKFISYKTPLGLGRFSFLVRRTMYLYCPVKRVKNKKVMEDVTA